MVYGPGVSVCWCGSTQCFGGCRVSLTGAPSSASHRQPSPYSGDDNPLSGPLIGPSWDVRSESPVKRLENAIHRGVFKPMSADELGLVNDVVVPPAKRFHSRFRTRRH